MVYLVHPERFFKSKPVVCYVDNFQVIRVYGSVREVSIDNFNPTCVCNSCKLNTKYGGYFWEYQNVFAECHEDKLLEFNKLANLPKLNNYTNLTKLERMSESCRGFTKEEQQKAAEVRSKKIQLPDGRIFDSLRKCEMITGINRHTLSKLAKQANSGYKFI